MTLPFAFKTHPYQENIILSSHVVISAIYTCEHAYLTKNLHLNDVEAHYVKQLLSIRITWLDIW